MRISSKSNVSLLTAIRTRLTSNLWFIPGLSVIASVVLSFLLVYVDRQIASDLSGSRLVFSANAEGARGVLSTIAGSIITVTGVVFSMTIVALQLASTQYAPRVLRSFTEDRATQVVLGIFIGTFTYSLLILRTVRIESDDSPAFVPAVAVTVAVGLAVASIAALVFFIDHITRSIRVENVLARIAGDLERRIEAVYAEDEGVPARPDPGPVRSLRDTHASITSALLAPVSGYLQHVRVEALTELAESHDLRVDMVAMVGDFIVIGDTLALVSPATVTEGAKKKLESFFEIGAERTLDQDLGRGLIEIADIAFRALSPALNDPTSAMAAIDRLTQILSMVGSREVPEPVWVGRNGTVRLVTVWPTFETLIHAPFSQLRLSGEAMPTIAIHLLSALHRIGRSTLPANRPSVLREIDDLVTTARRGIQDPKDLDRLLERVAAVRKDLQQDGEAAAGECTTRG